MLISREHALQLVDRYISNENMKKHLLATEAVMRSLAEHLDQDREKWGLAGLLHDLDIELVNNDLSVHGLKTEEILTELDLDTDLIEAIKLHNEQAHNQKRSTLFHHCLAAGETITGLIIATTLVYPDKKLVSVKVKSIIKRMKEKAFAKSVNREIIRECELCDIPLNEFAEIALEAMQLINTELGL